MISNKNTKPKLLIHIGYHKTGSTYWQKHIFSSDAINIIDRTDVQKKLIDLSPYTFSDKIFDSWLKTKLVADKLNVISDEELSGNIHSSGNGRSITFEMVNRISAISVADVTVLMFIRNQFDMLDSCYRQYVKKGGSFSFRKYIYSERTGCFRHRFPGFSFEHFKYDDVIRHWYDKLGQSKLLIFPYESFQLAPEALLNRLSEKIGTHLTVKKETKKIANQSLSNVSIILARFTNRFVVNDPISRNSIFSFSYFQSSLIFLYHQIDTLLPKKVMYRHYLNNDMRDELKHYFHDSNTNTQRLTNIDLKQYNYPFYQ